MAYYSHQDFLDWIFATSSKHRCLPPCLLQRGRHNQNKGVIIFIPFLFIPKILMAVTLSFFLGWRFGSLEDEQTPGLISAHPPLKIPKKLPRTETGITKSFKQVHRLDLWFKKIHKSICLKTKICWYMFTKIHKPIRL